MTVFNSTSVPALEFNAVDRISLHLLPTAVRLANCSRFLINVLGSLQSAIGTPVLASLFLIHFSAHFLSHIHVHFSSSPIGPVYVITRIVSWLRANGKIGPFCHSHQTLLSCFLQPCFFETDLLICCFRCDYIFLS